MPATPFQKSVKKFFNSALPTTNVDHIVCKKDGSVELKRSYFYLFGNTTEKFVAQVTNDMKASNIPFSKVRGEDRWAAWPKESYFVAIILP